MEILGFFNLKVGLFYWISSCLEVFVFFVVANCEFNCNDFVEFIVDSWLDLECLYDIEIGYEYCWDWVVINLMGYYMFYWDQLVLNGEVNDVGVFI